MNMATTLDHGEMKLIHKAMKVAAKKDPKLARSYSFQDTLVTVEAAVNLGNFQPAALRAVLYAMNSTIRKLNPDEKDPMLYAIVDDILRHENRHSGAGLCDINAIDSFRVASDRIYIFADGCEDAIVLKTDGFRLG